jgi:sugar phosphate isomerase/epimerase
MGVGLSTSWNAFRCPKAQELVDEIKALGFQEIELSFNLAFRIVEDIARVAQKQKIKIVSLHNYCPVPEGLPPKEALPDCYSLASINEEERKIAIQYTQRTIDTARALAAKVVVLHTGRVEMPDATRDLIALYLRGGKNTTDFQELKSAFFKERERHARPFFENTLRSLEELGRYAQDKGVNLGIENRFYYREIPSFEEIALILNKFSGSRINYWHDTGHAQIMENLGIVRQKEYLQAYSQEMCGIHIHNVLNCQDHRAPQSGEIDFSDLPCYLNKDTLKIIEAHYPASAEELKEGKKFLEVLLDGKL